MSASRRLSIQNRALVLALVLLCGGFSALSTAAMAAPVTVRLDSSTDGIAANPATKGDIDKSRTNFDYQLNPGQPASDSIYVVNTGSTPQKITLYSRDAFLTSKGDFSVQAESQQPSDVGSWVRFVNKKPVYTTTLKPKEFVTIPFRVNTPTEASPGDHVGAIVVSATTTDSDINIVRRIAIRLYARLSGQISPKLAVENLKVERQLNAYNPFESKQTISYDIRNTGNVSLSADLKVQAFGPFDINLGNPVTTRVLDLLPGTSRRVNTKVEAIQSGIVGLTIVYTGIFDANAIQGVQQPRGRIDVSEFVMPTGWLNLGLLVLIAGIGLLLMRRVFLSRKGSASK